MIKEHNLRLKAYYEGNLSVIGYHAFIIDFDRDCEYKNVTFESTFAGSSYSYEIGTDPELQITLDKSAILFDEEDDECDP